MPCVRAVWWTSAALGSMRNGHDTLATGSKTPYSRGSVRAWQAAYAVSTRGLEHSARLEATCRRHRGSLQFRPIRRDGAITRRRCDGEFAVLTHLPCLAWIAEYRVRRRLEPFGRPTEHLLEWGLDAAPLSGQQR